MDTNKYKYYLNLKYKSIKGHCCKNCMPFVTKSIKPYNDNVLANKDHIIVYSKSINNTESFFKQYKKNLFVTKSLLIN